MAWPKCIGPLEEPPTQTVKGGGHRPKPVHSPTKTDQNRHNLSQNAWGHWRCPKESSIWTASIIGYVGLNISNKCRKLQISLCVGRCVKRKTHSTGCLFLRGSIDFHVPLSGARTYLNQFQLLTKRKPRECSSTNNWRHPKPTQASECNHSSHWSDYHSEGFSTPSLGCVLACSKQARVILELRASPAVALNFGAVKVLCSALHSYFTREAIFTSTRSSKCLGYKNR
jgi:hypothetical protein